MFARSVVRSAARVSIKQTPISNVTRASFSTAMRLQTPPEVVQERSVPVTSYKDGERTAENLSVSNTGPVSSAIVDEQAVARPLDPTVIPQLTPTMAKFTLPGKVAVVTG